MFNTDLNQEYQVLIEHFCFQVDDLEQISLNSLRASLLPGAEKGRLIKEFQQEFKDLRKELT
jgi:adenosine deaminase